jgi:NTE family protein
MERIGIALSGGGARGISHLGVLKALAEFGIKPSIISGASAGSIAGAFFAAGYPPREVLNIIKKGKFFSFAHLLWRKSGFFDMHAFAELFQEHFPSDRFEDLNIPLHVAVTDIHKGETIYFSSGELIKILVASSCLPIVFEPVKHNGLTLVDGGLTNNLPVEQLKDKCEFTIGVNVNPISHRTENMHLRDLIDRSFHVALASTLRAKAAMCDLFIEPPGLDKYGIFDMKYADDIYKKGYDHTMSMRDPITRFIYKLSRIKE